MQATFREFSFLVNYCKSWLDGLRPADIYLQKVSNENTRTISKICPIFNLILYSAHCSGISIVNYEQVNVGLVEDQYMISSFC